MAQFDTIIRGATIVDGTGAAPFQADVAIREGRIAAMGTLEGDADEIVEAKGLLLTPGFVDIHSHYDGQLIWDDELEPSFSNGVTTVIAGNCGVGFAPARKEMRKPLIELMEGVEDIPGVVLDEGLDWNWESFPDYMARIDAKAYSMDVGVMMAHAPLRVYVMGERATSHEQATDGEVAEMAGLVREAMDAGSLGFSASRILEHVSSRGEHVPGTFAADEELLTIAEAMGESGRGVFQMVPLGGGGDTVGTQASPEERRAEHARMERIARASGRPISYLLHSFNHAPDEWREMVDASDAANAQGLSMHPQVASRGVGLLLSLDGYHIFRARPSYMEIEHLPRAERAAAMRDPARRAAILSEANVPDEEAPSIRIKRLAERYEDALDNYFVVEPPLDYEPGIEQRLDTIAGKTGRSVKEVFYDIISEGDGSKMAVDFVMNYVRGNLDSVHDMLVHPATVNGLADGGAHLLMICDAAMTTFQLTFWSRDRQRGPLIPIEVAVNKLTGAPARLFGLADRGTIEVGKRADLNLVDFEKLDNAMPEMIFDLPKGSGRLVQRASGYRMTMVNGVVTRRDDTDTGARPGRLVRSNQLVAA